MELAAQSPAEGPLPMRPRGPPAGSAPSSSPHPVPLACLIFLHGVPVSPLTYVLCLWFFLSLECQFHKGRDFCCDHCSAPMPGTVPGLYTFSE